MKHRPVTVCGGLRKEYKSIKCRGLWNMSRAASTINCRQSVSLQLTAWAHETSLSEDKSTCKHNFCSCHSQKKKKKAFFFYAHFSEVWTVSDRVTTTTNCSTLKLEGDPTEVNIHSYLLEFPCGQTGEHTQKHTLSQWHLPLDQTFIH